MKKVQTISNMIWWFSGKLADENQFELSRTESIFLSRVEGRGSRIINDDFFSEDIFLFFAGQSSSLYMFLPDLIKRLCYS